MGCLVCVIDQFYLQQNISISHIEAFNVFCRKKKISCIESFFSFYKYKSCCHEIQNFMCDETIATYLKNNVQFLEIFS